MQTILLSGTVLFCLVDLHSSYSKSIVLTPSLNWPSPWSMAVRRIFILEKTERICRKFSLCVDTAIAFRSSAKARMLCRMDVNPSSFGNHQRRQLSSRKSSAILRRIVPGDMYLFERSIVQLACV